MRNVHRLSVLLGFALCTAPAWAQAPLKRPLTHDDYDAWSTLRSVTASDDGRWIAYQIAPQQGDGVLEVRSIDGDTVHRQPLGERARFTEDGRFVVFRIGTSKDVVRAARIAKLREAIEKGEEKFTEPKKDDDAPKPAMGVLDLKTGTIEVIERVESFQVAGEGAVVAYVQTPEKKKKDDKKDGDTEGEKEKKAEEKKSEEPPATVRRTGPPGRVGTRSGRGMRGMRGTRGAGAPSAGAEKDDDEKKGFQPRDGKALVVRDLAAGTEQEIEWVLSHRFVAEGRWLLFDVQKKAEKKPEKKPDEKPEEKTEEKTEGKVEEKAEEKTEGKVEEKAEEKPEEPEAATGEDENPPAKAEQEEPPTPVDQGLFALELATGRRVELLDGPAQYGGYVTDEEDRRLAFWSNIDDLESEKPEAAIYLWDFSGSSANRLIAADAEAIPDGRRIAKSGLGFSRDGSALSFVVEKDPADPIPPILPEDKVVLDLWHWKDGSIQPTQGKRRSSPSDRWSCVCFLDDRRVVVLGDDVLPSMRLITPDGSRALATDAKPYEALVSWDGRYSDVWVVNTIDGTRRKLLTQLRGSASPSPSGRYVTYFGADRHWHAIDLATYEDKKLTAGLDVAFCDEDDDTPDPARAYGVTGWLPDETAVVLYDRYDLWKVDPRTGEAVCITDGYGRANEIVLRNSRIDLDGEQEDEDDRWLPEQILLSGSYDRTKAIGYFVDSTVDVVRPRRLVMKDAAIGSLRKPKEAERLVFTLSTFAEFPDVWTSDLEFGGMRKLTDANPMRKEVRWGKAELVEWLSADGIPLQGKLVVPDGFDPSRKYPMMVYFYEKLSRNLHRFVGPKPGTSPNPAYYVSNGYLWFEPDIVYREGYPGQSALKCIVPGVQSLIARGFVDEKAIGIAGHSWGGYQTAYLVTQTDLFAAAESGAPVSNMISAYGGIRWGSGMSRQFQYEQTQSRIGGTPWQYPMRFMENSPIFFADKVRTPVLILHNDHDGAVPWYQGIEYFMALRRLGKEAYLFNYVGEDHGLRKRQNQRDWTRRMQEFFDQKLKGKPVPEWMSEGVRYRDREREKIPFAPSYIEATSAPAATEAAEQPAEAIGAGTQG